MMILHLDDACFISKEKIEVEKASDRIRVFALPRVSACFLAMALAMHHPSAFAGMSRCQTKDVDVLMHRPADFLPSCADDEDVQVWQSADCASTKGRRLGEIGVISSCSSVSTMASLQDLQAAELDELDESGSVLAPSMSSESLCSLADWEELIETREQCAACIEDLPAPSCIESCEEYITSTDLVVVERNRSKASVKRSVTFFDEAEIIEIPIDEDAELLPILRTRSKNAPQLHAQPDDCCFRMLKVGLRCAFG